jgi:hypothetical protein
LIGATFFTMALSAGLSAAIMNPHADEMMKSYHTYRTLAGLDAACADYIAYAESRPTLVPDTAQKAEKKEESAASDLQNAIIKGLADMAANSGAVKSELLREIASLNGEIAQHRDILGRESLLSYTEKRIAELEEDAKNASACLDAIEKMLYLAEEYSRYKTKFVEDSINGMFRVARFRLFREQANGEHTLVHMHYSRTRHHPINYWPGLTKIDHEFSTTTWGRTGAYGHMENRSGNLARGERGWKRNDWLPGGGGGGGGLIVGSFSPSSWASSSASRRSASSARPGWSSFSGDDEELSAL